MTKINSNLYDVLFCPVNTEKSVRGQEESKYTFFIRDEFSKEDVKKAVEKIFEKKVLKINMIASTSKTKRSKKGIVGKKTTMKKVIVTLEKGTKIEAMNNA